MKRLRSLNRLRSGLLSARLDFDSTRFARFGDRDGEGEDTFVETRHDSLNVEVLAEEDLTREDALGPFPHEESGQGGEIVESGTTPR